MLTGDKLETAENIGESCKLLKKAGMKVHRLSNRDDVTSFCSDEMVAENNKRLDNGEMMGILVEATALILILEKPYFRAMFLQISKTCEAVICCRVSPG